MEEGDSSGAPWERGEASVLGVTRGAASGGSGAGGLWLGCSASLEELEGTTADEEGAEAGDASPEPLGAAVPTCSDLPCRPAHTAAPI